MDARPLSFAWLPRWSRAEAAHGRAVLRRLLPAGPSPDARRDALGPALRALLGAPCEAWPLAPEPARPRDALARFDGVALAAVMHHRALGVVGALIDAPFALTLAARALGADDEGARRVGAQLALSPALEGALAMLCAQAARLACAPSPAPVVRAVSDRVADLFDAMAPADEPGGVLVWPWRATVGLDAGDVTLVLDGRALVRAPERVGDAARDAGLVEVMADVVAARQTMAAREVLAVEPGDVLLCDGGDPREAPWLALGAVELPLSRGERGYAIAGPARARRSEVVANDGDGDADKAVRTELLAELPVEVEVVLGRAAFSVAEVAAWRVGELIALPARLGDPVLVRAGGRAVARGELCDVDGAVGVRVTERL